MLQEDILFSFQFRFTRFPKKKTMQTRNISGYIITCNINHPMTKITLLSAFKKTIFHITITIYSYR